MIPEQVFDDHHKAVYRFVYRLVGRADLAEDITQECFLAVLRAPQRWDADRGGVKTYLFSIARNLAFKRYRDDHANVQVEENLAASLADRRTDQELAAGVAQTVAQLPELQREVLPYPSRHSRSFGAAVLLQAAMVALLFAASSTQLVQKKIQAVTPIFFPQVYQPKLPTAAQKAAGGGDVSAPILVAKVEPEYSEEARKAKYSGTVLLSIVVDVNGMPRNIHVVRPLGLGLD